jgi:cystathionine gamma-lyase
MVGGVVVVNDSDLSEKLGFLQNAVGAVPGPMDCWLVLRGIKTLPLRMRQHEQNARELAAVLQRTRACRRSIIRGFRAIRSRSSRAARRAGSAASSRSIWERRRRRACSWSRCASSLWPKASAGREPGVSSCHHDACLGSTRGSRARLGISDGLVRLSVGVEDVDDLRHDVEAALARVPAAVPSA